MDKWTTVGSWSTAYTTTNPVTTNYLHMLVTGTSTNGWYKNNFSAWQKVNNAVYTYVVPNMFGMFTAQLYMRGTAGLCTLEARMSSNTVNPTPIFTLAEKWLVDYGTGDCAKLEANFFNIDNPVGAWSTTNAQFKLYYIN